MKLKIKLFKFNISSLIAYSAKYLKLIIIIISFAAFGYLGFFLYQKMYLTISQSEEIKVLRQEVAPYSIDKDEIKKTLESLDNKTKPNNINYDQIQDPFGIPETNIIIQLPEPEIVTE